MRHTSGSKHSTLAPEHAPVKTGNYSPTAAAMAIKLVGEKVYEMKKFEYEIWHNKAQKFNNFLITERYLSLLIFKFGSLNYFTCSVRKYRLKYSI